jgi:phospholipid N-methyltransferase
MDSSELARERRGAKLMRKVTRALGPAGVFFQGFLEHPKMVGSIIPSSANTIARMLAPVKWTAR